MFARIERLPGMGEDAPGPGEDRIQSAVRRYFGCIAAMDEESWLGLHSRHAVSFAPVGGPPARSREALRRVFDGIWAPFDALELEPDRIWTRSPGGAAVKWTGRGRARNGREVVFEGVDVFQLDADGRIVEVQSFWDPRDLAGVLRFGSHQGGTP